VVSAQAPGRRTEPDARINGIGVAGTADWNTATDPDGTHKPLLNVTTS
jgi:hypothetical protein